MTRRESRKTAFTLLFQLPVNEMDYDELIEVASEAEDIEMDAFCLSLVRDTMSHLREIDEAIRPHLKKWSIGRLPKVSLAVLRLSCAQLFYQPDLPDSVVINEAVELAKKYGMEKSPRFINGVLGARVAENEPVREVQPCISVE